MTPSDNARFVVGVCLLFFAYVVALLSLQRFAVASLRDSIQKSVLGGGGGWRCQNPDRTTHGGALLYFRGSFTKSWSPNMYENILANV